MTHAIGEIQSPGFKLNPNRYVNSFYDCALDKKCKIFYHHVAKTGGTHIEQKFQDLNHQSYARGAMQLLWIDLENVPSYIANYPFHPIK